MATHSVEAIVKDPEGLHARPSFNFCEIASALNSTITVSRRNKEGEFKQADAKSIIELLTLEALQGTVLTIKAEGDDAELACQKLKESVEGVR